MIKNTSGLAVQPCRLHERFYYHARLLYYILRQKARGFFARGLHPRGDLCKDGSPCTHQWAYPAHTRGSFLRDGSPSPQRCEGFPLCTPQSGRSAPRPGLLSRVEKVGKDTPGTSWSLDPQHKGGPPWIPPLSTLAVLVAGKKSCGILGGNAPAAPRIDS